VIDSPMPMSKPMFTPWKRALLSALIAPLAACSTNTVGTDTGNPLVDAKVSACKSAEDEEGASASVLTTALSSLEPDDVARYEGFACMRWEKKDGALLLSAYNFSEGCYVQWEPGELTTHDDAAATITLENPRCAVAACGACLYDAAFEVALSALDLSEELRIELVADACATEAESVGHFVIDEGESGLSCEYAKSVDWHASRLGTCGTANMPCNDDSGLCPRESGEPCLEGLSCTEVAPGDRRCLATCETKDDCALPEVMACTYGLCRLAQD
jgi:hypothetical protein